MLAKAIQVLLAARREGIALMKYDLARAKSELASIKGLRAVLASAADPQLWVDTLPSLIARCSGLIHVDLRPLSHWYSAEKPAITEDEAKVSSAAHELMDELSEAFQEALKDLHPWYRQRKSPGLQAACPR